VSDHREWNDLCVGLAGAEIAHRLGRCFLLIGLPADRPDLCTSGRARRWWSPLGNRGPDR
jgi:hypothetical protein